MKQAGLRRIVRSVDKAKLVAYLEGIDRQLRHPATLCVYGSAAYILLDEPDRTSLDVDVAAPYSTADYADFSRAAAAAGLPVNPDEHYAGEHIEWIAGLRLCLPPPSPETDILLWQGNLLTLKTVAVEQLVASKLIRYDEIDQSDIRYLMAQRRIAYGRIETAVRLLPEPFDSDPVVLENLQNLKADMEMWGAQRA